MHEFNQNCGHCQSGGLSPATGAAGGGALGDAKEIIFNVLFEKYLEWDDAKSATKEIMKVLKR